MEFELSAWSLLGRHSTTWATSPVITKGALVFKYKTSNSIFFLVRLRFEFGALHLQSRHSTAWATSPAHFALAILEMMSQTICLSWPQTMILLISASQIARITGMSHPCLANSIFPMFGHLTDKSEL
jgi:hypothetical protein